MKRNIQEKINGIKAISSPDRERSTTISHRTENDSLSKSIRNKREAKIFLVELKKASLHSKRY
jgi:hypothetical protein